MTSNVTLFSLAVASFIGVTPALQAHDYIVAGGLTILGIIMVYIYHLIPTPTQSL